MRPQDFAFFGSQTEQEISRKPLLISLHLLIQPLHIDAIEKSEIAVQNDFLTPYQKDFVLNRPLGDPRVSAHT
jgi:hypothetical protein